MLPGSQFGHSDLYDGYLAGSWPQADVRPAVGEVPVAVEVDGCVGKLLQFLPIFKYGAGAMAVVDLRQVIATATRDVAQRALDAQWKSALLVRVNDETLNALAGDSALLDALAKVRSLGGTTKGLDVVLSKNEKLRKAERDKGKDKLTAKQQHELKEVEKQLADLKERMKDLAARIPAFMYLSDPRERTLKEVIETVEPELFEKVTGLTTETFVRMKDLGVFNGVNINLSVDRFREEEEPSFTYFKAPTDAHGRRSGPGPTTESGVEP